LADHYCQPSLPPAIDGKKIPAVLEIEEVQLLLGALDIRERTMVLLDVVTGLRAANFSDFDQKTRSG
jgi:integrase